MTGGVASFLQANTRRLRGCQDFQSDLREASKKRGSALRVEYILPDFDAHFRGHILGADEDKGDDQSVTLANERFSVPELLFNPNDAGACRCARHVAAVIRLCYGRRDTAAVAAPLPPPPLRVATAFAARWDMAASMASPRRVSHPTSWAQILHSAARCFLDSVADPRVAFNCTAVRSP